ncbi:UDP-glucose 4-epimerase GalE [Bradyrhizobium sacchari]|uniref:UDP-glucose 4-epimerase n=1 Tax=Bradyrhizobium sacchari TaxID=1399419 RepID=A0A560JPG4_9BRAD|nr:UDP-glucose 4-epimerase GalE [Bradyrhizobium sacchari]OPY97888.1 UDP-glucose 4-epimerase GalE [Bradyrhizobium sacchari]TWB59181.1 UDP-galactose 4-epimerase [Bradyrhizobium sacchari]TWB72459.1 UDP-galactose 4-epimerase [Bradyrhizobium sacchari]
MTILVTGGAGYIGSHVVYGLIEQGRRVIVLDNLSSGFPEAVAEQARLTVGDVGDADLVSRLIAEHGIDAIMHFAASTVVPESVAKPVAYYKNNTVNSLALLDAAIAGGVRHFVFSSTAAVYGNPATELVSEDVAPRPMSPYGTSKLMTEMMLRDAASASGLSYVVLRYFNVAGADPKLRTGQSTRAATHLIKVAVQAALGLRDGMEIYGTDYPTPDGTCVRDYIHVCDLVSAHIKALDHLRGGGASATLNCGYGHGSSVHEIIAAVRRVSAGDFVAEPRPRRAGDPAAVVADSTRLRQLLSWTPAYDDLDTIVAHALAWERKLKLQ